MQHRLHRCSTDEARISWIVRHLKNGGCVDDASLWLAGTDRPMRLIGRTRCALREEGLHVANAMRTVVDASGNRHEVLSWSLGEPRATAAPGQTSR